MEPVAHRISSLREQQIAAKLIWKYRRIQRRIRRSLRPLRISHPVLVATPNRDLWLMNAFKLI
jgi:hypothetical protein